MTTPKTLVIGSTGHKHVTCAAWEDIASVNLKDFDIIVASVRSLTDRFLKGCKPDFFDKVRSALSSWLATGGELIVLGEKNRGTELFTNYSWLPIEIGVSPEEGTTILAKMPQYSKFMKRFEASKQWKFFYFVPQVCLSEELKDTYGQPSETEYKVLLNPIAENRSQEVLSGIINISVKSKGVEELMLNPITLLPSVDGMEQREAVNLVLEDKLLLPQEALPPEWIEAVPMPIINDIQLTINEKRKEIAALEQEIAVNQDEKQKLEAFKKLVYASGQELDNLFADCLELLGGKVVPAKYSEEGFALEYKAQLYLVECRGTAKSVTLSSIRQLTNALLKFEEDEDYAVKGILFGNAWNTLPLEDRGQSNTIIFPENIVKRAETLDIALVPSVDFFYEFCGFLAGAISGEEILGKMLSTVGVVEFEQVQPMVDEAIY